jgi:hypothetical protein
MAASMRQQNTSPAFRKALAAVARMEDHAQIAVPAQPSLPMLVAGARAGRVSLHTVAVIWQAMLRRAGLG